MTYIKTFAAIAATALCVPAFAMGQSAAEADANQDGVLSLEEVQAVYPDMTEEQFATVDLNGDGTLEDAEVQAGQEAGLMPAS